MTSDQVANALLRRHSGELRFFEAKNGPTWSGSHSRMDAVFIKKSWEHPRITGYEVKVSRSDFLRDSKWTSYLPMCNELYFACPKGLIAPEELPPEVGLCIVYPTGTSKIVKKAPYRGIEPPAGMLMHLLMKYGDVVQQEAAVNEAQNPRVNRDGHTIAQWIDGKISGRVLSALLQTTVARKAAESEEAITNLKNAEYLLKQVRDALKEALPTADEWALKNSPGGVIRAIAQRTAEGKSCRDCEIASDIYKVLRKHGN